MATATGVSLAKLSDGSSDTREMAQSIERNSAFAEYVFSHIAEPYAVDVYRSMHTNSLDGLRAYLVHTTR
jgi:hypothetical protein